ncbi:MAG: hypothetical protein JWP32_2051 [Schumannella sp.]|nr:hypothetical protein [Schumannella sp.]
MAAIVVGLLAGCASPAAPSETPDPQSPDPYLTAALGADGPGTAPGPGMFPLVPATHAHVQLQCPLVSAVHYDPAAIPGDSIDGVYVCTTAPYTDAPDGTPQIEEFVDRVAADDIAGLLDAYAVPDLARTDGPCDMSLHDPLIVWLHYGDERITPVYAPQDGCGFPTAEATAVYDGLELHRLLVAREKTRTS